MRAKEFILLEAKPENLGQGMLDKLFMTYKSKPDAREFEFDEPLQVANELFRYVGPNYLIWAAKQYNQDQHFFLHDLPTWKDTLTDFSNLAKDRRIQIEKDINRYQNIDQLRQTIEGLTQKQQALGSNFYSKAIEAIDEFVQKGDASWLYRGNDYSIYYPKTFESSNLCSKLLSTNVCTIMNQHHYQSYSNNGTLMYIITQDKLFNCFISKNSKQTRSEFADEKNNHSYDLNWMMENFPALRQLVKRASGPGTELYIQLEGVEDEKEAYKMCLDAVSSDGEKLTDVPEEYRTLDVYAAAVANIIEMVTDVPDQIVLSPEFITKVVELNPESNRYALFAPDELIDKVINTMADEAYDQDIYEIIDEWQMNDDYFYSWQQEQAREKGYLLMPNGKPYENTPEQNQQLEDEELELEDLEIDDDRIYNDDEINDYFDYNYDAKIFMRDAREAVRPSAAVVRDIALERMYDGYVTKLGDIEDIISENIKKEMKRESGGLEDIVRTSYPKINYETGEVTVAHASR